MQTPKNFIRLIIISLTLSLAITALQGMEQLTESTAEPSTELNPKKRARDDDKPTLAPGFWSTIFHPREALKQRREQKATEKTITLKKRIQGFDLVAAIRGHLHHPDQATNYCNILTIIDAAESFGIDTFKSLFMPNEFKGYVTWEALLNAAQLGHNDTVIKILDAAQRLDQTSELMQDALFATDPRSGSTTLMLALTPKIHRNIYNKVPFHIIKATLDADYNLVEISRLEIEAIMLTPETLIPLDVLENRIAPYVRISIDDLCITKKLISMKNKHGDTALTIAQTTKIARSGIKIDETIKLLTDLETANTRREALDIFYNEYYGV